MSILVATGFVRIDADTKPAMKALKAFGAIGGNLLVTAMGPAGAAVTTALTAVASSAAVAGGAVAVYGAAVKQQFTQVQEAMQQQKQAEDAATKAASARSLAQQLAREGGFKYGEQVKITANMTDAARARAENYNKALAASKTATDNAKKSQETYKTTLGGMPKATATLTEHLQKLKDDTKAWSDSMAGSTMPVFTKGIDFLRNLLPKLSPIVKDVAKQIDGFVSGLGEGAAGKIFKQFGKNVKESGAGALRGFLETAKNLVAGFVGILNAFMPMSKGITGGLQGMSEKFAKWSEGLGRSKGFGKFTDLAKETGPKLVELLKSLGNAFLKVASSAGPMAGIGLTLLTVLSNLINVIPTPVLQALVPIILAVNAAMKIWTLYTVINTAVQRIHTFVVARGGLATIAMTIAMRAARLAIMAWSLATRIATLAMRAFSIAMALATSPIGLIVIAIIALVAIFVVLWKKSDAFRNFWKTVWKGIKDAALAVKDWFAGPFVNFFTKTIPAAFQTVLDWVKSNWPWILGALTGPIGLAVVAIIKNWDKIKNGLKAGWDFIFKWVVRPWINIFTTTLPNAAKTVKEKVLGWWKALSDGLKTVWDFIYKNVIAGNIKFYTVTIPNAARTLKDKVVGFWHGLRSGLSDVYNSIKTRVFNPIGTFFTKTIPGWASTMKDRVKGFFTSMRDGIGTIWNGIKNKAKGPINWVLDHVWNHGIVAVWKKITGWIPGMPQLHTVQLLASGGTVGKAQPGVFNKPTAIVGEGNPRYPEYVIPTDPKYAMRSKRLWQAAGGHFMADGGILGGIGDFLMDPVGKSKSMLLKGPFKGIGSLGSSPWVKMITKIPHMAIDGMVNLVKKAASALMGAAGLGDTPGSGVKRWTPQVLMALRMVGQVPALLNITLKRMNQESGGNPTIVNKWDSNWKAGHPSVGLMQVIGPTFRAYAGKMKNTGPFLYGTSVNPVANIYASMRYALAAYGSLSRAYGRKGGYRNGTTSAAGGMHLFGEAGPEMGFSPSGWRILNARKTAGLGGAGVVIQNLVLENHGVIGSRNEVENWLVDSLTDLKRKGRLNL